MANRKVDVPVGYDTEPGKKDIEKAKSQINQFAEHIRNRMKDAYASAGKSAADTTLQYGATVLNVISDAVTSRIRQTSPFVAFDATKRLQGMVSALPGAEFAAGTPEGQKMIKKALEMMRPIAEQEARGAAFIAQETGVSAASVAVFKQMMGEIVSLLRTISASSAGAGVGMPIPGGR